MADPLGSLTSMKRILFFSSVYPRAYDPTRGTFCYAMCKAMAASHKVCVVSPQSWLEALRRRSPKDQRFIDEVGPTEFPCFYYPPGVLQSTYGWWMWNSVKRILLATARRFQPDAILSYWAHPDGNVAIRLGQRLNVPAGLIVGGSDILLLPRNPHRKRVISSTVRAADAVFAVSRDLREKTIALGADPQRVHVHEQGVDKSFCPGEQTEARQRLGLPLDRDILLWVGRMAPVKGLEVLLEAHRQVVETRPDTLLVFIGDGPLRATLEHQSKQTGLAGQIRFVGSVNPENLPDWYRAANLTVLSSHSEGIPNVLRESLSCGTPYVATRVGGIHELCDHPAIRLVPPRDPAAFAEAVADLLSAQPRIERGTVQQGWEASAEKILAVLCQTTPTCSKVA